MLVQHLPNVHCFFAAQLEINAALAFDDARFAEFLTIAMQVGMVLGGVALLGAILLDVLNARLVALNVVQFVYIPDKGL